jgi:hypothetical protein
MSIVSVNQDDINSLLIKMGVELKKSDPSISVVRFGSSQHYIPVNNIDIDILLLTNRDYFGETINDSIKALREDLLNGCAAVGFSTAVPMIDKIVENVLSETNTTQINFIPQFIFGPFIYGENSSHHLNVYLHFKGPLNNNQLLMFCNEMPFHAYSLIQNHKIISGSVDLSVHKNSIILDKKTLNDFNRGLKKRIENSANKIDMIKCIRKLLLNHKIFIKQEENLDCINIEKENLESKDTNELKTLFEELYSNLSGNSHSNHILSD